MPATNVDGISSITNLLAVGFLLPGPVQLVLILSMMTDGTPYKAIP